MRIFDKESLQFISLFELTTGAAPVDCIVGDILYFIVKKEDFGFILAKGGIKIKTLEKHVNRQIVIFPYMDTKEEFIKKAISDKVKIKDCGDSLKLFVSKQDNKKVKRDKEAIKNFLKRIYNVKETLFRW